MEGNQMMMREAMEFADRELRMATEDDRYGEDLLYLVGCMRSVARVCRAALSATPRNCDVGTAEEQEKRFYEKFCGQSCFGCPLSGLKRSRKADCIMEWAQMPYEAEEGGTK